MVCWNIEGIRKRVDVFLKLFSAMNPSREEIHSLIHAKGYTEKQLKGMSQQEIDSMLKGVFSEYAARLPIRLQKRKKKVMEEAGAEESGGERA